MLGNMTPAPRPIRSVVRSALVLAGLHLIPFVVPASLHAYDAPRPLTAANLERKGADWLVSSEGRQMLANILTYQTASGGWCKAYDARSPRDPNAGIEGFGGANGVPILDNGATYGEIRLLARAYAADPRPEYRTACERGVEFLLTRQYPNGGWPQRSPLDMTEKNYGLHITFNDGAMVGAMEVMRDIAEQRRPEYAFFGEATRERCRRAFDRGVECILQTQIQVGGRLTAWCQQHDEKTLAPANARSYELPSISGSESADIVRLLMQIEKPDARVRKAIEAAVAWFESAKITGIRLERVPIPNVPPGTNPKDTYETVVVKDPSALPLWARYYDLETLKPYFSDRSGVKHPEFKDIPRERRNGYTWYGDWGAAVASDYRKWQKRLAL